MKRTQLAAAVLLATGSVSAFAATYSVTPLPLQDTARNNFARSIDNSGKMFYFKSYRKSTFISFESIPNNVILPNLKLLEQIITELLTIKDSYYLVKMYFVQTAGRGMLFQKRNDLDAINAEVGFPCFHILG